MRIGIDATPLLGALTGVGAYTQQLIGALQEGWPQDQLVATAFTWRGRDGVAGAVPEGVETATRPVPARALRAVWSHTDAVPVELLCGPVEVFHATNFVLPPARRAARVLTVHDLAYLRFPDTVSSASLAYRDLVPRGLARADVVLTPSRAVADQLRDAYALGDLPVRVTPLGVDRAWFDVLPPGPEERRALGISRPYVLAVGTQEPRKNLAALVRAHARMTSLDPSAPDLVIAGGSGWGDALRDAEIETARVVLPGYLADARLRSLVAGASVLAYPSLDEGFGLPPLEAMACGVPVVVNDLPVTREVLGSSARFCDAGDDEALAAALRGAVADPPGADEREALRAHAATYTWARCAELTRSAYREAVQRRA